jgi:catechol 2,3-dioxygenase-like lactoylglutathione lyase family enzyme
MNRIHVITLGIEDINRSLKFYRDGLGFKTSVTEGNPPIVFFQSEGVTLALFPKEGLAEDIDKSNPPEGFGFSGTTFGYVVGEKDDVEKILKLAEKAGGKIVKPPQRASWGGYHGYFSDPDGYYWEVMYWENWKFKPDGALYIE